MTRISALNINGQVVIVELADQTQMVGAIKEFDIFQNEGAQDNSIDQWVEAVDLEMLAMDLDFYCVGPLA